MEDFSFTYPAGRKVKQRAHIGVVGSGDMEILLEPGNNNQTEFIVRTASDGFRLLWKAVFDRFVVTNNIDAVIAINDFGSTPGVVGLRLAQAIEIADPK
ncbi:MAG: malonate decarboxylase subunit delta [Chitinophagaceae bacterium]